MKIPTLSKLILDYGGFVLDSKTRENVNGLFFPLGNPITVSVEYWGSIHSEEFIERLHEKVCYEARLVSETDIRAYSEGNRMENLPTPPGIVYVPVQFYGMKDIPP